MPTLKKSAKKCEQWQLDYERLLESLREGDVCTLMSESI